MKVLITGAFGNLGSSTLEVLLAEGKHEITCADIRNPKNEARARELERLGSFETVWAGVCEPAEIATVIPGHEAILHMAGIIPPLSELDAELVKRVNIGGTHNVIEAARAQPKPPKVIFTSSCTVHGCQYEKPPPRHAAEEPAPMDNYTHSKVRSEKELRESGVPFTILRITAAMPVDLLDREMGPSLAAMFDIPLAQRIETVHPTDVATGVARSIDADTAGKILYLGGGPSCQMLYREFMGGIFDVFGLGMPPESAFRLPKNNDDYWYTDFVDTDESQALLRFQNNSFDDYLAAMKEKFGWRRPFAQALRPLVMRFMLRYSRHY